MIVQRLYEFYQRMAEDEEYSGRIPQPGWSTEKVSWALNLTKEGELVSAVPLMSGEGKTANKYLTMMVPVHSGRSGTAPKPYFLCDTAPYFLGERGEKGDGKRVAAKNLHETILRDCDDDGARAFFKWFASDSPCEGIAEDIVNEIAEAKGNLTFYLAGDGFPIFQRPLIKKAWESYLAESGQDEVIGQCSVTGEVGPLARLFPQVNGLPGAQSSGASLISFNLESFNSYGKTQTYNASITEDVAFGAGTALKYLLTNNNRRIRLGNTFVIFWSEDGSSDDDDLLWAMLAGQRRVEDEETSRLVAEIFNNMRAGRSYTANFSSEAKYFILGVSPNAARISVRFYNESTLGQLANRYAMYLQDVDMVGVKNVSLLALLRQTAALEKEDNLPSTLVCPSFSAMLNGTDFPMSLQNMVLSRMRADHASQNTWDMGQRAAILRACLVRRRRRAGRQITSESELSMSLNRSNTGTGYLLGRLFAVMERAQQGAVPGANATIRDRYIGAASSTPQRVMQPLLRNCQTHLGVLRKDNLGLANVLERELDEILGSKWADDGLPATLDIDQQAEFFIGYYQERTDLWTSKKKTAESDESSNQTNDKED